MLDELSFNPKHVQSSVEIKEKVNQLKTGMTKLSKLEVTSALRPNDLNTSALYNKKGIK